MDNLKNIAEQLARRTQSSQSSAFNSVPSCGYIMPPPEVKLVPQALSKVILKITNFDLSGFDATAVTLYTSYWDVNGGGTGFGSGGPYDLTTLIGRNTLLSDLLLIIDTHWSTTSSGTIGLVGSNLSIDILANATTAIPMSIVTVSLSDPNAFSFALPITFQ